MLSLVVAIWKSLFCALEEERSTATEQERYTSDSTC
jgi:hypothetical protein